jgi:hypothetical protein
MEKFIKELKGKIYLYKTWMEDPATVPEIRPYHEGRIEAYEKVIEYLEKRSATRGPAIKMIREAMEILDGVEVKNDVGIGLSDCISELEKAYDLSIEQRNKLEQDLEAEQDHAHNLQLDLAEALDEKDRLNREIKILKDLLDKRTQSVYHLDNLVNFLDVAPPEGEVTTVLDFMNINITEDVDFADHCGEPKTCVLNPIRIHTGDKYFEHIKILHPNEAVVPTVTGGRKRFKLRKK